MNIDNPHDVSHGAPDAAVRHVGDFGNINVTGSPYLLHIKDNVAKLDGPYSILGVSISVAISSSVLANMEKIEIDINSRGCRRSR